jgi:rod shape-determining protein MreD
MFVVPPAIRTVPAAVFTLFLAMMSLHVFELSQLLTLSVLFVIHPLYYWTVFRPSIFPVWLAFVLGFLIDLVSGNVLGLNAFLFVLSVLVIAKQQRYLLSQPFAAQWAGFFLVSLSIELMRWLLMMLVNWAFLSPAPGLVSAILSGALYPVTALVMLACLRVIQPHKAESSL